MSFHLERTFRLQEISEILGVAESTVHLYHAAGVLRSRIRQPITCTRADIEDCWNRMGTEEFQAAVKAYRDEHSTKKEKPKRGRPAGTKAIRTLLGGHRG